MGSDILEKLKQIPLFEEIKDNQDFMQQLQDVCKTRHYKANETIIKEGEVGSEMFVVLEGAVEILKRTRAGDSYTVVKLRALDNVFFGELALIDDDRRSATVVADKDSDFLVISKDAFLKLGDSNPSIGLPITRALAKKLAAMLRKTTSDMLTIFDALVNEIGD